jgi:hypothetical protein
MGENGIGVEINKLAIFRQLFLYNFTSCENMEQMLRSEMILKRNSWFRSP